VLTRIPSTFEQLVGKQFRTAPSLALRCLFLSQCPQLLRSPGRDLRRELQNFAIMTGFGNVGFELAQRIGMPRRKLGQAL
jgi:hypothetical protein